MLSPWSPNYFSASHQPRENTELCKCPEICAAFRILEASQVSSLDAGPGRSMGSHTNGWFQLPLKLRMGMTSAPLCLCVFISGMDIKYISQVIITHKRGEEEYSRHALLMSPLKT